MPDFMRVDTRFDNKTGGVVIYPSFHARRSNDLMIKASSFYAGYDESTGLWTKDPYRMVELVDEELDAWKNDHPAYADAKVMYLWDVKNGYMDHWRKFVEKQLFDNYTPLDQKIIFANQKVEKGDFASKRTKYPLEEGPYDSWDELVGTLYSPEERHKIEWAIGAVVSGDSKKIQKFIVFYGDRGTGKSTILHVFEDLFDGYCSSFSSKDLVTNKNLFATEAFRDFPLVSIDHEGKLNRIEDNTVLNSLTSHEIILINEKHKSQYSAKFNTFLVIAANDPVMITNAQSGLLRRLIDIVPTGNKIENSRYRALVRNVRNELGGIAYHCLDVYNSNPRAYDDYVPTRMLGATNHVYNFAQYNFEDFRRKDIWTLNEIWPRYQIYVKEANIPAQRQLSKVAFKEELKNYFVEFKERAMVDGMRPWNVYFTFRSDKFEDENATDIVVVPGSESNTDSDENWIELDDQSSIFDSEYADYPAQYATDKEIPSKPWDDVDACLREIDTRELHYVKVPLNHVVIDFDKKDADGKKSLAENLKAAAEWPKTYVEISKSGQGLHLHYIYTGGDPMLLDPNPEPGIEVKVFSGKQALRRKLTKCNSLPISNLNGCNLKKIERRKATKPFTIKTEEKLREIISKHLKKAIVNSTAQSVKLIHKTLEEAYDSGLCYDIRDMRPEITEFANLSTNQAAVCLGYVADMKFTSSTIPRDLRDRKIDGEKPIVIFDTEVFPNLLVVCWKILGSDEITGWINPSPQQIEWLIRTYRLVGFNNLRYDNYILHARRMEYTVLQLYELSSRIINKSENIGLTASKYVSYTDIFDFSSEKKSLKKFEIEYGCHHQECGLKWDEPVPEDLWERVVDYCRNDVAATEIVWYKRHADFLAREILAKLTGMTVNDTTNQLTTRLIFGDDENPQAQFNYVKLGGEENCKITSIASIRSSITGKTYDVDPEYTCVDATGQMIFPGYNFRFEKVGAKYVPISTYRGEEIGEGGYVYAEPGMYFGKIVVKDVAGQHPSSAFAMNLFGTKYTQRYKDLVRARILIKHNDFEGLKDIFDGKLMEFVKDPSSAKMLSKALKIAINSVYGLTAAKFQNPFRDSRNVDNIMAKRGALFMVNLKHEVQRRGFAVIHIKTDSIKVENMTAELEDFIHAYGELYGYSFETEHVYDRLCLVNNAVYIAKCSSDDPDPDSAGGWSATGKQFAVPFVFKTLFTKEKIAFEDLFETVSVTSSLYLDMNEDLPDVRVLEKELEKLKKKAPEDTDRILALTEAIKKGHNYIFVGRVGAFCPIKPGAGGGILVRDNHGTFAAATGTKDFRWLEAELVKRLGKEDDIDYRYYDDLVDAATAAIKEYGDIEKFIGGEHNAA